MSIITKIYNTIKPPIVKFVELIDIILMLISGLATSVILFGVAVIQEHKILQEQTHEIITIPTEEELAEELARSWTSPVRNEEQGDSSPELIEELQLEQKLLTNVLETPHPYSLGDHNAEEPLSELMLCQEEGKEVVLKEDRRST